MRLAKQFTALRNAGERTLVAHANQSTDEELVVERAECHLLTDLSGTVASVCMCPVQNIHVPRIISSDVYEHPVVQRFVGENTMALFWHLGNCLVDPKATSDVLAIHGRSGAGKSTLLRCVQKALGPVCANISFRVLTSLRETDPGTITDIVCSRIVVS